LRYDHYYISNHKILTQAGKYALQVFPEAGHFIHEDLPEKTAIAIVDFYKRNDRSTMVFPPKVSDMLKAGRKV
jgi:protein phosphatase methylesterase 1